MTIEEDIVRRYGGPPAALPEDVLTDFLDWCDEEEHHLQRLLDDVYAQRRRAFADRALLRGAVLPFGDGSGSIGLSEVAVCGSTEPVSRSEPLCLSDALSPDGLGMFRDHPANDLLR